MSKRNKVRFFVRRNPKLLIKAPKNQFIIPFRPISILIILILSAISVFFALRSDLFQVRRLQIKSSEDINECLSGNELNQKLDIVGKSVIFIDADKLGQSLLSENDCLKSVKITTSLPNKINLELKTRKPVAAVVATNSAFVASGSTTSAEIEPSIYLVDDEAIIFRKVSTTSSLPKILVFSEEDLKNSEIVKKYIKSAVAIISQLANYQQTVNQLTLDRELHLFVELNDDLKVLFSEDRDPKEQAASLQAIQRQAKIDGKKLKQIDLRFDKPHVIYK